MAKITRSPRAKADVLSIGRQIAEQSQNPAIAYRFLDKIDEKIKFLAQHPLAGEALYASYPGPRPPQEDARGTEALPTLVQ